MKVGDRVRITQEFALEAPVDQIMLAAGMVGQTGTIIRVNDGETFDVKMDSRQELLEQLRYNNGTYAESLDKLWLEREENA